MTQFEEQTRLQTLRSQASEFLLREEWIQSIESYSQFISLCKETLGSDPDKLRRSLCLAYCNRAEARFRLRDFNEALKDCDQALEIESTHFKTLLCKGKILLNLDRYSDALKCFNLVSSDAQCNGYLETVNGYVEKCKKLENLSRNGGFNVSDWVLSGFKGRLPEFAEFVGCVEIKRSEISGRGLFAAKNLDSGSLILVTKAIATERCILPNCGTKNAQLVIWKNFIDLVIESAKKCPKTRYLISKLSSDEDQKDGVEIPDVSLFRPDTEGIKYPDEGIDLGRILSILDVNSLVEDSISAKVLGKNSDFHGVGLWLLPSFINHSCTPNARRVHIGDHVMVHVSRDVKMGEEITFAYFDVLTPLKKRKELAKDWGFDCSCKRCKFEGEIYTKPEIEELEIVLEKGLDVGNAVFRLEECIKRWVLRGKEKGYVRASFWSAFKMVYMSEKVLGRWGRRMPMLDVIVESLVEVVGSDERVLKVLIGKMKKNGGRGVAEMERVMKLGRGLYGKIVRKQALRVLLEQVEY